MDSFPQDIMDPLPEMSIQDAESVLGMASPSPYPNQQPPPSGPATPSANQNAPSPLPYSSQFPPRQQRTYPDVSDVPSPMIPPPSYPPSYPPPEPNNPPYGMPPRPSFPPGYSPHPQFEGGGEMHHSGVGQHPSYMSNSFPQGSGGGPYPPSMNAQRSMEFPPGPGMYGPEHMMSQPPNMAMHPEMSGYSGEPRQ